MRKMSYFDGMREGVRRWAWWKDGQQYVGSCGTTLTAALAQIDSEDSAQGREPSALDEAGKLLREAIECPFESDPARWEAWCAEWRPRAEALLKEIGR